MCEASEGDFFLFNQKYLGRQKPPGSIYRNRNVIVVKHTLIPARQESNKTRQTLLGSSFAVPTIITGTALVDTNPDSDVKISGGELGRVKPEFWLI